MKTNFLNSTLGLILFSLFYSENTMAQNSPSWYSSVATLNSNQSLVGIQSAASKLPASLVGLSGIVVDSANKNISVKGSGLVISNVNFSGWDVTIDGGKNTIRNCVFTTGSGYYPLLISKTAIDTTIEYNSFVGPRKADNVVAPIYIEGNKGTNLTDGARNTIVRRNHISGYSADGIKVLSSPTLIEENLILVNAFTPGAHGDQISIQITKGAWPNGDTVVVQHNYISQVLTPDHWRWSSSARFGGTDSGKNGPNNAIRAVVNSNDSVSVIKNILITQNILEHDRYIKSFPYQSTNTRTSGIDVIDNIFGFNLNNRYAYPNSNISLWNNNVDLYKFLKLAKP